MHKDYYKYLYGQHFLLLTDHSTLRFLLQFKNPEGQLTLFIERLQIFDFIIEHRHLGLTKTLEKLKQCFYWGGCQQAVADWIANCTQCIAAKGPIRRLRGQLQQYNSGAPFERIAKDVAGPFPVINAGNRHVLVVMDFFSKSPEVYDIPNQEANILVNIL